MLLSLLEHLFLLYGNSLFLLLFFLSDSNLFSFNLLAPTLLTSPLTLPRSEIIIPHMALPACDLNNYLSDSLLYNFNLTCITLCLNTCCIHNLDTIMANYVLIVSKLMEMDHATSTGSLAMMDTRMACFPTCSYSAHYCTDSLMVSLA